jgi:hypothetical protein
MNEKKLVREDGRPQMDQTRLVMLGDKSYEVAPQRIGYLRSRLGVALGNLDQLGLEESNVVNALGNRVHAVLNVFIPDLMPEWEFAGFPTKEAQEKGEYDEQYDKSPSPPEIRAAFMAAAEVNEIDLLKHVGKLIGPNVIRGYVAGVLADSLENQRRMSASASSSVATDTPSTKSGTNGQTSDDQQGSLSLGS